MSVTYRRTSWTVGRYALLVVGTLVALFPIVWAIASAFRTRQETFGNVYPLSWKTFVPVDWTFQNFIDLFSDSLWDRYLLNTIGVGLVTTVSSVIVCSLAGYALARMRLRGSGLIFVFVLSMAILPFEVIAFPLYLVVQQLGLLDTYAALVLPWISNAFIIFLLRQFFLDIPKDFEEAARLDGAGPLRIYFRVFLPLTWPAHVSAALLCFQESWDQFLWPLIVTSSERITVLQLGIASLISQEITQWNRLFAAVTVGMTLPILLFLVLQKYYVRGLTMSGLK